MTKELLINLTMLFIYLDLLTLRNIVFKFWGGGIWVKKNDARSRQVRTVFIMAF